MASVLPYEISFIRDSKKCCVLEKWGEVGEGGGEGLKMIFTLSYVPDIAWMEGVNLG